MRPEGIVGLLVWLIVVLVLVWAFVQIVEAIA
jgi:hypothetical protein